MQYPIGGDGPESDEEMDLQRAPAPPAPPAAAPLRRVSAEPIEDQVEYFHGVARSKGWWPGLDQPWGRSAEDGGYPCNVEEKLALIVNEVVGEALEDYRSGRPLTEIRLTEKGKPEGFLTELADAHIRILDLVGGLDATSQFASSTHGRLALGAAGIDGSQSVPANVAAGLKWVTEPLYHGEATPSTAGYAFGLARCFVRLHVFAQCHDLHDALLSVIDRKAAFNLGRPFRHGGKIV
jgi:hypothetical protein